MQHSLFQASTDEDGRLRTVYLSIHPCGQWTKIWAETVHLMDECGRWTKIIILWWTSGRFLIMDRQTDSAWEKSWTDSDDVPTKI